MSAGSIVVTKSDLGGSITKYSIAWTADGAGAVNGNSFDIRRGRIYGLKFVPGAPAPTDAYTATLLDADGADLLAGAGTPLSATVSAYASAALGFMAQFVEGFAAVRPTITGSVVASAQGTIVLYIGP